MGQKETDETLLQLFYFRPRILDGVIETWGPPQRVPQGSPGSLGNPGEGTPGPPWQLLGVGHSVAASLVWGPQQNYIEPPEGSPGAQKWLIGSGNGEYP